MVSIDIARPVKFVRPAKTEETMMTTTTIETIRTPPGTYGLAVAPWSADEVYAVAADWAQASSPVLAWLGHDWGQTTFQVADFRHRDHDWDQTTFQVSDFPRIDRAALEQIIQDAIEASGSIDAATSARVLPNMTFAARWSPTTTGSIGTPAAA